MARRSDVAAALARIAPRLPRHESEAVLDHAEDSRGLSRAAPERAAWLSLVAYARHVFTDYDDLIDEGYDPDSARHFVAARMTEVLAGWGVTRPLDSGTGDGRS